MPQPRRRPNDDPAGFDEITNYVDLALGKFVPNWLARRAVDVSVSTDRERYERGEPVDIVIEFHNRLPLPVRVPTPGPRLWGWTVDGVLEATDERRHVARTPAVFEFRGGERKRIVRRWNGHFRRAEGADGLDVSEPMDPGEHEITAFLATGAPGSRPEASTTITVR